MMLWKGCTQYANKFGTQQWPQEWKRSVFIPIPKTGSIKECSNYCTIALISHAIKAMLKILQTRLQKYVNWELADVQAGFKKGRATRDQIANISWIIEKAREFQKCIYFCFIDYTRAFDCVDHNTLWKILKRWGYKTTLPPPEKPVMQVKKQQLELDMEQWTGSKLGKECILYSRLYSVTFFIQLLCRVHCVKWRAGWNQDCW